MHFSLMGSNSSLLSALNHLVDGSGRSASAYLRDAKAMTETPADVIEDLSSYSFVIDMPGLRSSDVKVQIENDGVLVVSGERKKREEEEREGVKYLRMERRIGKLLRKFVLPENANVERISATCNDGVLVVTVEKLPPPAPKTPKTIEVRPMT